MKLLYYLHTLSIGGAQQSALAMAREMRRHGNEVVFAGEVQGDAFAKTLQGEGFACINMPFSRKPLEVWRIARRLAAVCSREGIDVCHAYYYTNYYFAWTASLLHRMPPIAGTFCGGPGPRYHIPRLSPVIVFSEEQKDVFTTEWDWRPDDLLVSPGRVEPPAAQTFDRNALLSRYELNPQMLTVLFVSRLSEDKRGSVEAIAQLAREIPARRLRWQILVAGGGALEGELRKLGRQLRQSANRTVIAVPGEQLKLEEFYACADIVAGVGRSIFDGMMRGMPALVVGGSGFAGLAAPETVRELAYYNFSGRNASEGAGVEELVAAISRLASPEERQRLGSFARKYAEGNLAAPAGAKVLLEYYEKLRGLPPNPRLKVLREVALSTISYIRRKGFHA